MPDNKTTSPLQRGQSGAEGYFVRTPLPARIGLFSVGHAAYWPQFPGLLERLRGNHAVFAARLAATGAEVIDAGMSDSSQSADEVAGRLARADVDLLVCYLATYAPSSTALPVVQRVGRPVVMAALQPRAALDYARATTFEQLANDNIVSLPEICCALRRADRDIADAVVGRLDDDPRAWGRLEDWIHTARALHAVRRGRIGLMGHVYEGMLDMNSDPTMAQAQFGAHVEHLEIDDLHACVAAVTDAQVAERLDLIRGLFHFPKPGSDPIAGPVDPTELAWAARVSVGLEALVAERGLAGLAYYYRGSQGNENERLGSNLTIGSSLLTGRGIPIAGEYDLKNCLAMLMMDRIGAGGSFAEIHPIDFDGDFVLVGHDGPHHIAIAQGRPVLRGLSVLHGKRGRGPSVEFSIRNGPITLFGLTQTAAGRFKFVVAEGESLPGMIPATGNTNTRARFKPDVRTFLERWSLEGPTHHFALGVGHRAATIEHLGRALGIECAVVARESAPK
ncbi:MAG: L-fucose/L-arabinose isomerase family protein [bacterium]|nr:L-fucose/L-arabinose isomerase family protein [bacterium]